MLSVRHKAADNLEILRAMPGLDQRGADLAQLLLASSNYNCEGLREGWGAVGAYCEWGVRLVSRTARAGYALTTTTKKLPQKN